ncbi:MAG: hypothetical protein WCE91_08625 [Nitrososphaeraceae archaeon]
MLGAVQNIFSDLKHYINADLVNSFKDALDQELKHTLTESSLELNEIFNAPAWRLQLKQDLRHAKNIMVI